MAQKEKILVYPFDVQFSPILRHKNLLQDFEITSLISPNGWGFNGLDSGSVDGGSPLGLTIHNDFEKALNLCDTVLFTESMSLLSFKDVVYPKIMAALKAQKNIITLAPLKSRYENEVKKYCQDNNLNFTNYHPVQKEKLPNFDISHAKLYEMNTTVIFVFGLAERTHKFEIQLTLREKYQNLGYQISQIGTRSYCELLGFHSFPDFMYSNLVSESEKVVLFNHFLKRIEKEERPDLIIIGIPGGVIRFNNQAYQLSNHFGILAYEIAQAVTPDASILSVLYEDFKPAYFELLSETMKHKFGFEVDSYNLANIQFDWIRSREANDLSYITIDSHFVDLKKQGMNSTENPIYNILNPRDANDIAGYLIDKLSSYGNVERV